MATKLKTNETSNQYHEFVDAARALECDESEERFNAALGKIARHKPKPDAPPTAPQLTGHEGKVTTGED